MHENQEMMHYNVVLINKSVGKTNKQDSQNYGSKKWCSAEMGFLLQILFSLKCLEQERLGCLLAKQAQFQLEKCSSRL